jgi:hypothetical protein
MSQAARCEICKIRPVMSAQQARAFGVNHPYCAPCLTQAEWENTHSDYGHDVDGPETDQGDNELNHRVRGCWVCFPELDETTKPYRERTGSSRLGIVLHVSARVTGKDKAAQTAAQLPERAASITTRKGFVTLKVAAEVGTGAKIVWENATGLLVSAETTIDGKTLKARNVAEVLRRLAAV